MDHEMTNNNSTMFCTGPGRVMMPGFQSSVDGPCILYLFEGVVVNTQVKYAFAVIGTFFLAVANEVFIWARKKVDTTSALKNPIWIICIETFLYGLQMVNAYWLMLLVMTYEYVVFIAIILGLAFGHFFFRYIKMKTDQQDYT